jgi:hypothetical protein
VFDGKDHDFSGKALRTLPAAKYPSRSSVLSPNYGCNLPQMISDMVDGHLAPKSMLTELKSW